MNWRELTAEQLEYEYNPRVTDTAFGKRLARLVRLSEDTRERLDRRHEDVRYGSGPLQTLDVFPAASAQAPVHVFFHGGYWRGQDKRNYAFVARDLVPRGVTVVVANYDLCPTVTVADIHAQCVACIAYLQATAGQHGISHGPLSLSGHSAGGQIVARLVGHDWGERCPITGVLAISGVFDVTPIVHTTLNDVLALDEASARQCSPLHAPPPPPDIPLRLAVGGAESTSFHEQSRAYGAHAGVTTPLIAPPRRHHLDVLEALFLADDPAFAAVAELVGAAP